MDDKIIICRCEEITYGEIISAIAAGCHSVSSIKKYTRAGMGSCQGRVCAPIIIKILKSQGIDAGNEDKPNFPCIPITIRDMEVIEDE
jgi:sarcosine oxidase subunit beta